MSSFCCSVRLWGVLGLGRTHIPRRPEIHCLSGQRPSTIIPICGRESQKQAALSVRKGLPQEACAGRHVVRDLGDLDATEGLDIGAVGGAPRERGLNGCFPRFRAGCARWDDHARKASLFNAWENEWCPGAESNHRHCDFQSHALPTELPGRPGARCAVRVGGGDIEAVAEPVQSLQPAFYSSLPIGPAGSACVDRGEAPAAREPPASDRPITSLSRSILDRTPRRAASDSATRAWL